MKLPLRELRQNICFSSQLQRETLTDPTERQREREREREREGKYVLVWYEGDPKRV